MENSPLPNLTAVVALTPSGVIGLDGDMPWRLRADLQRFKRQTMGGILLMGRKTYESIGRPLPGRETIVITRQSDWSCEGVRVANSISAALEMSGLAGGARNETKQVFVVGGGEIYRQLIDRCSQIFQTRVWSAVQGDTHLELDLSNFRLFEQSRLPSGPKDDVPTEFLRWVRKKS